MRSNATRGPVARSRETPSTLCRPPRGRTSSRSCCRSKGVTICHMPYFIWHMAYEIWHMKSDYSSECSPTRLNILGAPSGFGRLFLMVAACVLSSSCSKTPPPRGEEKPIPPQALLTADTPAVKSAPDIPAAKPEEVTQAVDRVCNGDVTNKTEQTP